MAECTGFFVCFPVRCVGWFDVTTGWSRGLHSQSRSGLEPVILVVSSRLTLRLGRENCPKMKQSINTPLLKLIAFGCLSGASEASTDCRMSSRSLLLSDFFSRCTKPGTGILFRFNLFNAHLSQQRQWQEPRCQGGRGGPFLALH